MLKTVWTTHHAPCLGFTWQFYSPLYAALYIYMFAYVCILHLRHCFGQGHWVLCSWISFWRTDQSHSLCSTRAPKSALSFSHGATMTPFTAKLHTRTIYSGRKTTIWEWGNPRWYLVIQFSELLTKTASSVYLSSNSFCLGTNAQMFNGRRGAPWFPTAQIVS